MKLDTIQEFINTLYRNLYKSKKYRVYRYSLYLKVKAKGLGTNESYIITMVNGKIQLYASTYVDVERILVWEGEVGEEDELYNYFKS